MLFGKGTATKSIGTVTLDLPIGPVTAHIINAPTPFLLCLKDMDDAHFYLDNTRNLLVHALGKKTVPVIRKWGHAFFFLSPVEAATLFLTETELRRLHRRFGHPAHARLYNLLRKAGHEDVDQATLEQIERFCHHCQKHAGPPRRFKFTLQDDKEFNYEVIVDVMYLNKKPVLHVVDAATAFQSGRFLPSMSAADVWEALCQCWINVYIGPPDTVSHDAGTNFASAEFRNNARIMGITCRQVPVEAHNSIGKVERYHGPAERAFSILWAELNGSMTEAAVLQLTWKCLNDTVGPDGLVPTLLVFGTYPRINMDSPPSISTLKRADATRKTIEALRRYHARDQVSKALATRNGPATDHILSLPLQTEVLVFRKHKGWQGPYKIAAFNGHNVTLDMPNGPAVFRSNHLREFHRDEEDEELPGDDVPGPAPPVPPNLLRKRGRPPGSKNKPPSQLFMSASECAALPTTRVSIFLSQKEKDDLALSIKLRKDGIITTPGQPFEDSDAKEIEDLLAQGVFNMEMYSPREHGLARKIYNSRMVREIKGKDVGPYEKSRLVIQGYGDQEKKEILTASPTIQRASQRLLLALAPSLREFFRMILSLRDITQAYPQSKEALKRLILAYLPKELRDKYPIGTIMRLLLPLYGIAEAGVYWFKTYQEHHVKNLGMTVSSFDPCLLITLPGTPFGMVAMQTDDTLNISTEEFSQAEEAELQKAEFRAKAKTHLTAEHPLEFNGNRVTLDSDGKTLLLTQKSQGARIQLIPLDQPDKSQQYVVQRARGAYIASICQPEASFDCSIAAQAQQPTDADIAKLNKRLQWQMANLDRGIRLRPMDLRKAKLMVFTDGSFANNADCSSQIGFVVALAVEDRTHTDFTMTGNVIHWSSTKCKRVTRSVLASEVYGMVSGFDIALALATTLKMITTRLDIPDIPMVVCTDSYSLYECLVKLGTTKEKRLMIDLMALRESYQRREINEIRWIHGDDNPADAMTKSGPNQALEKLVSTGKLKIRMEGFVIRPEGH